MTQIFILIAAHYLADFYFQTATIAREKATKFRYLLVHAAIYSVFIYVGMAVSVHPLNALLPAAVVSLSHFAIDWLKITADRHLGNPWHRFGSFCLDQIIHIVILFVVYYGCLQYELASPWWNSLASLPHLQEYTVYSLILLLCLKPCAIFVSKLLECFGQSEANGQVPDKGGYVIGLLERFIVAVLIINGHIGEIAFVLTAKSVARFKEFDKDGFAEKFLIGTMASISFALAISLFLLKFI